MRTGKYAKYVHLTLNLPAGLRDRVDELARTQKGSPISRNGWIVRELARRSHWGEFEVAKKKKEVKDNE